MNYLLLFSLLWRWHVLSCWTLIILVLNDILSIQISDVQMYCSPKCFTVLHFLKIPRKTFIELSNQLNVSYMFLVVFLKSFCINVYNTDTSYNILDSEIPPDYDITEWRRSSLDMVKSLFLSYFILISLTKKFSIFFQIWCYARLLSLSDRKL